MFVRIERGSAVPVSRQIADQIRAQCLSGRLVAGTQVPSVRQLARELAVNQNTVLRVYERLAAEGLLDMRHGEGTFVAHDLPAGQLNGQRLKFLDELMQIVRQGRLLGLEGPGLHTLLDDVLAQTDVTSQDDASSPETAGEE